MDDTNASVGVALDTSSFARAVAAMRAELEGPLAASGDKAGRAIEAGLLRAVKSGKLGFEDLKTTALSVLSAIAAAALKSAIASIVGGGDTGASGGDAGLSAAIASLISGSPGRATGGPVSPGRPYMVGERGPELFVPTTSGRIETGAAASPRDVRIAITVNAGGAPAPAALAQSSRQVARAVKAALGA